jgi:hypothetical protein
VPWGLLGTLVLVAVVERFSARHDLELSTILTRNTRFAVQGAEREAAECEVLCFGDSQVKLGVDPKVLEDSLHVRAFNLAILSAPPPASYFLLRRALEAGARPSALLVGHMTLVGDPRLKAPQLPEFVGLRESLDLAWRTRDAGFFASLMLARLLPAVRARETIRATILASLQGRAGSTREAALSQWKDWRSHRGAHLAPKNPLFQGHMEPQLEADLYSRQWVVTPLYAAYFRRFLDLAASRDIPVFWLLAPLTPEAQSRREALGLDALHTRNVRAFQARHPNLFVVDARHSGYPHTVFIDSCHLDAEGAHRLTSEIAAILGRHRGVAPRGSRWIEVAAYREPTLQIAARDGQPSREDVRPGASRVIR